MWFPVTTWTSNILWPDAMSSKVFIAKFWREALLNGSKGSFMRLSKTKEMTQDAVSYFSPGDSDWRMFQQLFKFLTIADIFNFIHSHDKLLRWQLCI